MVENKKVVKDHIISDGDWCWAVPILAYQAHRDGDGNEIKSQYATKSELTSETNARIQAVSDEATARQDADNLKLDIPQFVFEGSEEGNECYIAKGTDDFVPPEGVIPIANIGNLTVTGSLNYSKMVTTDTTQTISGGKTFQSAPWFHGTYTSFRSYTKFSDYKQSDTPSDKRMYIHSILDNANTNIGHVEMGTDNNGTRDYLSITMRGSGSSRNGTLQLRANYQSSGTSLQFFDPIGDGAGALWMNLYQNHINPSENGNVVAPLSYLNSESKATYLVHRAGTETITGQKIFNKSGDVLILKHPTLNASAHNQGSVYQEVTFHDSGNREIANIINWTSQATQSASGNTRLILETKNLVSGVTAQTGIVVRDDGVAYTPIPTITANTPSQCAVNKAYVESTDGTTNNLVHRSANENISGLKTFKHDAISLDSTQSWATMNMSSRGQSMYINAYRKNSDDSARDVAWRVGSTYNTLTQNNVYLACTAPKQVVGSDEVVGLAELYLTANQNGVVDVKVVARNIQTGAEVSKTIAHFNGTSWS